MKTSKDERKGKTHKDEQKGNIFKVNGRARFTEDGTAELPEHERKSRARATKKGRNTRFSRKNKGQDLIR